MAETTVPSLAELREVARDPSAVARAWKAGGGKVAGCRCIFVPEEIIWAAGMLPHPLLGTPEPVRNADAYFQSCSCEFARNLFDLALDGKFDFLDGLALPSTCEATRRLYDVWVGYKKDVPALLINNPQKLLEEGSLDFYMEEMRRFRAGVEALSGRPVTDESLREAIALYNRTRMLLREISSLRKKDPPALTGEEMFDVAIAASVLPRDRANDLLGRLLQEMPHREARGPAGPRVLVTGSVLDNAALIRMIEEEGGVVVADDVCTTLKAYWKPVEKNDDPMTALVRSMNARPLCPCMHPFEARMDYLAELIEEYRVDAVVHFTLKYCHTFLFDAPLVRRELERRGVPATVLEVGHDLSGLGQIRTRVQAFLEMLESP